MKAIRTKLCGLLIEGALEPAHCLLDLTANMHQINEVRYIAPERCVSRSHEVLTSKTPSKQLDISAESFSCERKERMCQTMAATSALQVHEALQRRGIALVFRGPRAVPKLLQISVNPFWTFASRATAGIQQMFSSVSWSRLTSWFFNPCWKREFSLSEMRLEFWPLIPSCWRRSRVTGSPLHYCHWSPRKNQLEGTVPRKRKVETTTMVAKAITTQFKNLG